MIMGMAVAGRGAVTVTVAVRDPVADRHGERVPDTLPFGGVFVGLALAPVLGLPVGVLVGEMVPLGVASGLGVPVGVTAAVDEAVAENEDVAEAVSVAAADAVALSLAVGDSDAVAVAVSLGDGVLAAVGVPGPVTDGETVALAVMLRVQEAVTLPVLADVMLGDEDDVCRRWARHAMQWHERRAGASCAATLMPATHLSDGCACCFGGLGGGAGCWRRRLRCRVARRDGGCPRHRTAA